MLSVNPVSHQILVSQFPLPKRSGSSNSVAWLKTASLLGGFSAAAMIISGLAINAFGLAALGVLFGVTSSIGIYAAHQFTFLKEVDEYTAEISSLNERLRQKDGELQILSQQMSRSTQELAAVQQEYQKMLQDDQEAQAQLNQQLLTTQQRLQKTTEDFNRTQADASSAIAKTMEDFGEKEGVLKKELDKEGAQIILLQQTVENAKQESDRLHGEIAALKQTLTQYTAQNQEYAHQNMLLQQQIKEIGQVSGQTLHQDIAKINNNSQKLQDLISQQHNQATKVVAVADQLKDILDRIEAVNGSVSSSIPKPN